MKNKKISSLVTCLVLIVLLSAFIFAEEEKLSRVLPADYSYRTGLEIKTSYYESVENFQSDYFEENGIVLGGQKYLEEEREGRG